MQTYADYAANFGEGEVGQCGVTLIKAMRQRDDVVNIYLKIFHWKILPFMRGRSVAAQHLIVLYSNLTFSRHA